MIVKQLQAVLESFPGLVRRDPRAITPLLRQVGVPVARCPTGRRILAHFIKADNRVLVRLSERVVDDRVTALMLLHIGIRVAVGQTTGLITTLVITDVEVQAWLAVADCLISDELADHLLGERLDVEEIAIATDLPPALVHAKLAARVDQVIGHDGASASAAYHRLAAEETRSWLETIVAEADRALVP